MASVIEICNAALIKIGEDTITSLDDNTKSAKLCKLSYDRLRKALLRTHPWKFAIKRASLALRAESPVYKYSNSFQIPTDCLRIIERQNDLFDFEVVGRTVECNETTLNITYISDVQDPNTFDPLFVDALSLRIALELAESIVKSTALTQSLSALYKDVLIEAETVDGQENPTESWDVFGYDEARIGGTGFSFSIQNNTW